MSEHTDRVLEDMGKSPGFAEHVERTLGWHLEHKRLGFDDPIADLYEELLNEKAQLSEENATFEQKAQQTDYISRQAAQEAITKAATAISQDGVVYVAKINALMNLDSIPAADVVEVVRCKDCKNYPGCCCHSCNWAILDGDDYCSYGERRNDG